MFDYIGLILGFSSVLMQFTIFLEVKKFEKPIAEDIFEGVFFKVKRGYVKKVIMFYYNPASWSTVKSSHIRIMLLINFVIVCSFLALLVFGKYVS